MTVVIHGTKKFRDRVPAPTPAGGGTPSAGPLDRWYANLVFWRPQVAVLVNVETLLPMLMPLAPASTYFDRFPGELQLLLEAHGGPDGFIDARVAAAGSCELLPTRDRSLLGVMNEFVFMAEAQRDHTGNLVELAVALSRTPCGPLYDRHVSPERELAALIRESS